MSVEELLIKYDTAYAAGKPLVSDSEYDALRDSLPPDHPYLSRVGSAPGTVKHLTRPMLSLSKCTTKAEFAAWRPKGVDLVTQYKVDGVACSLLYGDDGRLLRAATRGDGLEGEDITRHVRHLPQTISSAMEVRGELYISRPVFDEKYAEDFANARNLVAGILGTNGEDPRSSDIEFFVYDAFQPDGTTFPTLIEALEWAMEQGFDTDYWGSGQVFDAALEQLPHQRYEADGIVVSINDREAFHAAGFTAHHPRGAIAWKFPPEERTSVLEDVIWQTARSGKITPVAVVRPVKLTGATVTRATLHNAERFLALKCRKGSTVRMVRRGGVIPHIEQVLQDGDEHLTMPISCPQCGASVEFNQTDLFCAGTNCGAQVLRSLVHFASTAGMDGWGPGVISDLVEEGLLQDHGDFWRLQPWDHLEGYGEASVQKLLAAIPEKLSLQTYIAALGLPGIGNTVAWKLCSRFTREELIRAPLERLVVLPGIGVGIGQTIVKQLQPLLANPRAPLSDDKPTTVPVGPLNGQVIVFTGELQCMPRVPAQKQVVALGGEVGNSVTRKTTLLVASSDEMTSKRKRATELGVRIVDEPTFLREFPQFIGGQA